MPGPEGLMRGARPEGSLFGLWASAPPPLHQGPQTLSAQDPGARPLAHSSVQELPSLTTQRCLRKDASISSRFPFS